MSIAYDDLASRLTPEAAELFREMVATHLAAGPGDRRFMLSEHWGGTSLNLVAKSGRRWGAQDVDPGALLDLADYGLLRVEYSSRGTPNYRVSGEGLEFYRWWMTRQGEPIDRARDEVRRIVTGDAFAAAHPGAAHHLSEAFDLLVSDRVDHQTVSEIGDHLRKALMDVVSDVVGDSGGKVEQPVKSLEAWLGAVDLGEREREVVVAVVQLARSCLRLDHRLNHIRDEVEIGEPEMTPSELRRAAFATAMACEQIAGLSSLASSIGEE